MEYEQIPRTDDERSTLLAFLEFERATLERKCRGLSDEQLRLRAAPPSPLSLLGLVRHMAEVERGWFQRTLAGEAVPDLFASEADPDADFNGAATAAVTDAFAGWRDARRRADELVASRDLDTVVRQRTGRAVSLRWILVHMVEEYSRHNGHADLLRERIDGAVGY